MTADDDEAQRVAKAPVERFGVHALEQAKINVRGDGESISHGPNDGQDGVTAGPAKSLCTSRRGFLQYVLLSTCAALGVDKARADTYKMTKTQAAYIARDKPATQMCAQCLYFISPNDCVIVQGPVSPLGWCTYYGD